MIFFCSISLFFLFKSWYRDILQWLVYVHFTYTHKQFDIEEEGEDQVYVFQLTHFT